VEKVFSADAAPLAHAPKDAPLVVDPEWRIQLHNRARIHVVDAIVADSGFQPVRNAQQRLALEALEDRLLDLLVCLEIDR